jgi:hypothetical protein
MFGAPVISLNHEIPNAFPGDAMTPHPADIKGSTSTSTTRDPRMGAVTTVQHAANRGTQENNRINLGNISTSVESSVLVSVLVKASVDCDYMLGAYADGSSTTHIPLAAGEWTRLVIYKARSTAGKGFNLVGWPGDTHGPAVSFSALQVLVEPTHSFASRGYAGSILSAGAVNPNQVNSRQP